MPVATACSIALAASERHRLKKMAWGHRTEYQLHVRAHIVLHAARGLANARIAERVGVRVDTVRRWRGRFAEKRLPGLADRKRTGRPPPSPPADGSGRSAGVPLEQWTADAEVSRLPELRGFGSGLRKDWDAVMAGLTLRWTPARSRATSTGSRCSRGRCSAALSSTSSASEYSSRPEGQQGRLARNSRWRRARWPLTP